MSKIYDEMNLKEIYITLLEKNYLDDFYNKLSKEFFNNFEKYEINSKILIISILTLIIRKTIQFDQILYVKFYKIIYDFFLNSKSILLQEISSFFVINLLIKVGNQRNSFQFSPELFLKQILNFNEITQIDLLKYLNITIKYFISQIYENSIPNLNNFFLSNNLLIIK